MEETMEDTTRSSSVDPEVPLWYGSAPKQAKYPWKSQTLTLPPSISDAINKKEAHNILSRIKKHGNESLQKGESYEALWRYEHALLLCDRHSSLRFDAVALRCNIAKICLKMGDEGNEEFLEQLDPSATYLADICSHCQVRWYVFAYSNSCAAFSGHSIPNSEVFHEAFYLRSESLIKVRRHLQMIGTKSDEVVDVMKELFSSKENPYDATVIDFVKNFRAHYNPSHKVFCDVLIFAVNNRSTTHLPPLSFTFLSELLAELIVNFNSTEEHIRYVVQCLEDTRQPRPYSDFHYTRYMYRQAARDISPSQLLERNVMDVYIYEKLIHNHGMVVVVKDIVYAARKLSVSELHLLKLLVEKCSFTLSDIEAFDQIIEETEQSESQSRNEQFVAALKGGTKKLMNLLVREADQAIEVNNNRSEVLTKYLHVLEYCYKYDIKENRPHVHINCAKLYLELQKYSDAYEHCMECTKLDLKNQWHIIMDLFHVLLKEAECSFQVNCDRSETLTKYHHILDYCYKYGLDAEQRLHVRTMCAKLCLKLHKYSDAYIQCMECTKLDAKNHEVLFYRAEAIKGILSCSNDHSDCKKTYKDVVKDYVDCHKSHPHFEAFCNAVIVGHQHQLTELVPKLQDGDIQFGLSTALLNEVVKKNDTTESLLNFILFHLPPAKLAKKAYDASDIDLVNVLYKTSSYELIERLIELKMKVKSGQITTAVSLIPPENASTFELLLQHTTAVAIVEDTCLKAITALQVELAVILICHGATPPVDQLIDSIWFAEHPVIQEYITKAQAVKHAISYDTPCEDVAACKEKLQELLDKANHCIEQPGGNSQGLKLLIEALYMCKEYKLIQEAASVHRDCAKLLLQTESYTLAYRHADASIKIQPDCDMVYIWRATSLSKLLQSDERILVSADLTYQNVIDDYCKGHELKPNIAAIVEAILVAVDHTEYQGLSCVHRIQELPLEVCNKVILEIISRSESTDPHFEFLVNEIWNKKNIDVSMVTFKRLIVDKGLTSPSVLQRFIDLGLPISEDDIKMALNCLKPSQECLISVITAKASPNNLDALCQEALSVNHVKFAISFIEQGAKLPVDGLQLLVQVLKIKQYDSALSLVRILSVDELCKIDLSSLMDSNIVHRPEIVELLIHSGVNPNGTGGRHPMSIIMGKPIPLKNKVKLVQILLDNGVDCCYLCETDKHTTPLHKATEIALNTDGDLTLIESVVRSPTFDPKRTVNKKGETPFHLVVKSTNKKKQVCEVVLSALLKIDDINPVRKDHSRNRPIDLCNNTKSAIYDMLNNATNKHKLPTSWSQQNKSKEIQRTNKHDTSYYSIKEAKKREDLKQTQSAREEKSNHKPAQLEYKDLKPLQKLESQLKRVIAKESMYFEADESSTYVTETFLHTKSAKRLKGAARIHKHSDLATTREKIDILAECATQSRNSDSAADLLTEYGLDFDELPWEVEVTSSVVKFFKSKKKVPSEDQWEAASTIESLAKGERGHRLSKKVICKKSLQLYEARTSKDARILWEKAVTFSTRLTGSAQNPLYTQVIRVWVIVLDHDNLERRIKYCAEQIQKSHQRGSQATASVPLQAKDTAEKMAKEKVRGREKCEMPIVYTELKNEVDTNDAFIPSASTKDNEYNVTIFHRFDTLSVKSMLLGANNRRDYPMKVWPKEHEIITLVSNEAILLLGRSGTGKSTCCLYRLWNDFKNFWHLQSSMFDLDQGLTDEPHIKVIPNPSPQMDVLTASNISDQGDHEEDSESDVDTLSNECDAAAEICAAPTEKKLHQVFVTKNYILCDQMKKHFYDIVAAYDFFAEHMKYEDINVVNDLSEVDDHAFPLFLTAREFYLLLDRSLGKKDRFFQWNEDGKLDIKIASLDYDDDPDVLLDFEESDSEDEDFNEIPTVLQSPSKPPTTKKKWTEVTALYFKDFIWPKISHQCNVRSKDFDPILVWTEIQSFIKGSRAGILKGRHLNLEEYKEIGDRMAPNFSSHRDTIYKLYCNYQRYQQNQRNHSYHFDECDLVLHLYNRLKKVQDIPWSIHSFYIDEVQDFTQAELATIIHCCSDPNSMFFTGDTAQSIMRGIAFRFQDLRSIFYDLHSNNPQIEVPHKPYTLTNNFRSHLGILNLAGSVIDLIEEYFNDSIDNLPADRGMFPGPIPVVLASCEIDDLAMLLGMNKRERSTIEFGAHQAVIVQSKEAKDKLPSMLKGAIVLTIFEAKGLEFDDVLLYNFFTDSLVDEKVWRVVSDMPNHSEKMTNPGTLSDRKCRINPKLHKSLNTELKYLYTALTRAKCNLWIYDQDERAHLPMYDYWHKRKLVKIIPEESGEDLPPGFAANSLPEQWKAQGDYFRSKHLWEQAMTCYQRAGPDNEYLAKEIEAFCHIKAAKYQNPKYYLEAAVAFLECDEKHHNLRYIRIAARCLKMANPPKYCEAGKLYERLGKHTRAAQLFLKGKDTDNFLRLQRKQGQHVKVLKEAKFYDKAFSALVEDESFKDACRLAVAQAGCVSTPLDDAQGWLKKGLKVAKMNHNMNEKAYFMFQMAKLKLKQLQADNQPCEVDDVLFENLESLLKSSNYLIKAEAYLILGVLKKDAALCHNAWRRYKSIDHRAGELESFNQVFQLSSDPISDQILIKMCHIAKETCDTFQKCTTATVNRVVQEGCDFYGLQKIGLHYYMPERLDIWIGESLLKCVNENDKYDQDGMIRLETSNVRDAIATHCQNIKAMWLSRCTQKQKLEAKLQSFAFHQSFLKHGSQLSRMAEVSTEQLHEYLQTIIQLTEIQTLLEESTDSNVSVLVSLFAPAVCTNLPQQTEFPVTFIRTCQSTILHNLLRTFVERNARLAGVDVDSWLNAWRVSCVSEPAMRTLINLLLRLEADHTVSGRTSASAKECECQNEFVYWKFYHVLSPWLMSCKVIREKGKFLWASQLAISHFLGSIVKQPHIFSLGAMNVVNILCIHCTGILAMLSHIRCLQRYPMPLTIPLLYKSIVNIFSAMNNWKREDKHLLMVCACEVNQSKNIEVLFRNGCQLIVEALGILIGANEDNDHSVLSVSLNTEPSSHATKQCLILIFVLLGNLSMLSVHSIQNFHETLQSLLKSFFQANKDKCPRHISLAYEATEQPHFPNPPEVFKLVGELLHDANVDSTLAQLKLSDKNSKTVQLISITPLQNEEQLEGQVSVKSETALTHKEERNIALADGAQQVLSRLNPELIDANVVTYTSCNVCGVLLVDDYHCLSSGDTEQGDVSDSVPKELYLTHVSSDIHESNVMLCKRFVAEVYPKGDPLTDTTGGMAIYRTLYCHLSSLLGEYKELKKNSNSDKLSQPISTIEKELEKNNKLLAKLEETHQWREANKEMHKMKESMDRLLMKYKGYYAKVSGELKGAKQQDKKSKWNEFGSDEEDIVNDFSFDQSKINGSTETGALRSENDKIRSRERKKRRNNPPTQENNATGPGE